MLLLLPLHAQHGRALMLHKYSLESSHSCLISLETAQISSLSHRFHVREQGFHVESLHLTRESSAEQVSIGLLQVKLECR